MSVMIRKTATQPNDARANIIAFPQARAQAKHQATGAAMTGAVNRGELTSIKALASYVAHNKNLPEDVVRNYLLAEFRAPDVANLKRADYERVVRFLVDLQIDIALT